ncbi:MAG: hypothetical protein ACPKOI_04830 [Pleomorphochaeta sp.]
MKKKLFTSIFLLIFITTSLFANLNYKFEILSLDPIHKGYLADKSCPEFSVNYSSFSEGFPSRILQNDFKWNEEEGRNDYVIEVYDFNGELDPPGSMFNLKIGETLSLGRSTFDFDSFLSPIAFDVTMQGLAHNFYTGAFDGIFSYDSIYFLGFSFRVADKVSMRFGLNHHCSHYGDMMLKLVQKPYGDNPPYSDFNVLYKFLRMNDRCIGLSIEPTKNIRVYGELLYPPRDIDFLRPKMFAPHWKRPDTNDYPDSYQDRIVYVGVELSYPIFKKLGNTTLAYNVRFYEQGKVKYNIENGSSVWFDEDAPWEREHDIKINQELNQTMSLEANYHYGRSIINNFYFEQTKILSIGVRYNPKSNIVLLDTKKTV